MRCLYCGKHLALFKKLTGGGEFCSDAHKQAYHEEYNRLALNRLMEAQTRQDEQTPRAAVGAASHSSTGERPADPEPKAKGQYFKQAVEARKPGLAMPTAPFREPAIRPIDFPASAKLYFWPEPVRAGVIMRLLPATGEGAAAAAHLVWMPPEIPVGFPPSAVTLPEPQFLQGGVIMQNRPVRGAAAVAALTPEPARMSVASPVPTDLRFEPQLAESGVIMENRPVSGATAIAALTPHPAGMSVALPALADLYFEPRLSESSVVLENRPVSGTPAVAALVPTPAGMSLAFPAAAGLQFEPELSEPGLVVERHPIPGVPVAPPSGFVRSCFDVQCVLPEHRLEIDDTKNPAASGPKAIDIHPAEAPEPELRSESASTFQWSWEPPEGFDPDWADGLEFATSEERVAAVPLRSREWTATEEVVPVEIAPEKSAPAETAHAETEPEPEQPTVSLEPALEEPAPVQSILAAATPEPVIDDDLLLSLVGGRDEVAPSQSAAPADDKPTPAPVVAEATAESRQAKEEPRPAPQNADALEGPVPPHEPGSFLPVIIRPAGAPSKSRLMQSFQAIALVSANPQIPTWNVLPLRPRMALGRPPGPGASLLDRARPDGSAQSPVRKPNAAAVEVASGPEPEPEIAVPTFGSATKPRSGLSRWFKLGVLIGVLGTAGGAGWLSHPVANESARVEVVAHAVAEARQEMITEFAACRS